MASGEGGGSGGVLRELLAVFGFGVDTKDLEHGESKLNDFFGKVKHVGEGLAAAFAVEKLYAFAEGQAHILDQIDDTANALGISTERVQQLRFASESLGDDADKLLNSLGRLQVAQQKSAQGSKAQADAFSALGVHVKDANGHMKSADELFLEVADGIKNTEDPSKAAAAAVALFGRSGRELLPFLKEGREGAEELFGAYKDLGGAYTKEAIESGAKFDRGQAKLNLVFKNLKSTIVTVLLPVLTKVSEWATKIVKGFVEFAKHSNIVQAALVALAAAGAVFAVQMAIAASPILLMAVALAAVVLAIDEVITLFQGGETVIGPLIDKIFGKGASADAVKEIKEAWDSMNNAFHSMVPAVKEIWDFFKYLVEKQAILSKLLLIPGAALADIYGAGKAIGGLVGDSQEGDLPKFTGKQINAPGGGVFAKPTVSPYADFGYGEAAPGGGVTINNTINAAPGMDEKAVGQHVAHEVHKVIKKTHRDAAATFQRSHEP